MRRLTFAILFTFLFASPVSAQDISDCDPSTIAQTYSQQLASATTLESLTAASNQLELALAVCRYADSDTGTSRVNPAPPDEFAQVTDAFSIKTKSYADITSWLANQDYDVEDDMVYITVFYDYQCDLPPDELCESYQSIAAAVSVSGNVYEAENIRASDFEWGWELYGGAIQSLYSIFAIDETDAEGFVIRFQDYDDNYGQHTRFFEPGEQRQID